MGIHDIEGIFDGLCGHVIKPKSLDLIDTLEQTILDLQSTNLFLVKEVDNLKGYLNCLADKLEIVNKRLDIVSM